MTEESLAGYNGRLLRVNLTDHCLSVEEPAIDYYQRYLGGRGFISQILLSEVAGGIDPLGPENKLVIALGPLTGMPMPGSGRNSFGAKSPLSGAFGESEAGGFFGAELKRAGFDAVIVEGASERPVYLWINNGQAELREADHLWGLEVADTQEAIRQELGDNKIRTSVIGPAGERLVRFACILNDVSHAAGRTGLGAVMGSKGLKALAVRGRVLPRISDPQSIRQLARWMSENYKENCGVWRYGTGALVEAYSQTGNLPTFNFREGSFDQAAKITAVRVCEDYGQGMYGCYSCPIRCKKRIKIEGRWSVNPVYGGPEYETLAAFGSNCGVSDLEAICKAHEISNRQGMDTISAGATIAFAMDCFEQGILTSQDTGGLELRFGNAEAMLSLLEQIGRRQGLGELLGEGSRRAAREIGRGAEDCSIQVKGVELPMHDPRLKQGLGLNYSINPAGADHCTGVHDTALVKGAQFEEWSRIDINESIPSTELSPRKARMIYQVGLWGHLVNYLGLCLLVPYTKNQICQAVEAATGWPMSYWRLMKTAERGLTLAKLFNLREGLTEVDDSLPRRMATSHSTGNLKGVAVDPEALEEARQLYYGMMGWDERGMPTLARLVELDLLWAAQYTDSGKKKRDRVRHH